MPMLVWYIPQQLLRLHHVLVVVGGTLTMKGWLFVHIPLTYGLLVFSVAHVVIIYAFSGGAR